QLFTFRWQREQQVGQIMLEDTKANLEAAHEQLKQLDRFKSQFFANITHEFKTPLAMILSPLELVLHGELGELAPAQRGTFEMMFRSGMKLLKLIGDLLDLSKLEESRLRLKVGVHALFEHLRETRRHGGTGIVLALAREIVELHGGRIRAENDQGARFTVELRKDKDHFRPEVLDRRGQRRDVLSGARAGDRGLMDFAAQMQAREEFRLLDIHEATERRTLERDTDEDRRSHTCLVVEDTPD